MCIGVRFGERSLAGSRADVNSVQQNRFPCDCPREMASFHQFRSLRWFSVFEKTDRTCDTDCNRVLVCYTSPVVT